MAEIVVVDGPAQIRSGTGVADALETVGYTVDGVEITEEILTEDVPGDENGGPAGPPIDVQYFGEYHIVRLAMSKWDPAIVAKLEARLKGGTAGVPGTPGTLYSADSKLYRLLINPTSRPRNYLGAIPRAAQEINKGTKYSTKILVFHCYSVSGTIYNTTTS